MDLNKKSMSHIVTNKLFQFPIVIKQNIFGKSVPTFSFILSGLSNDNHLFPLRINGTFALSSQYVVQSPRFERSSFTI